jgi:tetratricopeptide (TPR) repeat protein
VAFATAGLDVKALPAAEVAQRLSDSLLHQRLAATLDAWLVFAPSAEVREVLRRTDADLYRDAVRDAVVARDEERIAELAGQAEAAVQPSGFTAALSRHSSIPVERRREVLEVAVRARTGDLPLLLALALTYLHSQYPNNQKNGVNERLRWLQAAVAAHPRNPIAHNSLGVALADKGDRDGAIAAYKEAIKHDPNYAQAHSNLGNALHSKGDLDGAVAACWEAIRLDPRLAPAHTNLGVALRRKGNLDAAIAAHREAIRHDPKHAPAHNNLGIALRSGGDLDGAIAAFKGSIRSDPKYTPAHINLGRALMDKKDVDGAISAYRQVLGLDPKDAVAHYLLGNALRAKGDLDGTIGAYRAAVVLDSTFPEAHCNLGHALRERDRLVEAAEMLRKGHELGRRLPGWSYPSAKWVADCEKLLVEQGLIAPAPREVGR